jgi:1-acyl-sn-glycerol-3-phosphate acyltransferase
VKPFTDLYFRPEVSGLDNVPADPAMLVGNHDGGYIPVDAICLGVAWHFHHGFRRPLNWLMHDVPFRISPRLTQVLSGCGCLPASRASLRRALGRKESLCVYPGGAHEAFRPFLLREQIDLGNRTGFVAEALRHRVPIVPVVSVGAHDTLIILSRGSWLARHLPIAKKLRTDVAPVWLGLPWGLGFGPLPHLPLPAKIKIKVLPPIALWEHLGSRANPDDPAALHEGLMLVRGRMQAAADALYAQRRYPVIG